MAGLRTLQQIMDEDKVNAKKAQKIWEKEVIALSVSQANQRQKTGQNHVFKDEPKPEISKPEINVIVVEEKPKSEPKMVDAMTTGRLSLFGK